MTRIDRRSAMSGMLAASGAAVVAGSADAGQEDSPKAESRDRRAVLAAGMTEKEADCWAAVAAAAGSFFALPELHPMDKHEVASAIHVIQNKLLGRPTYRKYLETAKQGD